MNLPSVELWLPALVGIAAIAVVFVLWRVTRRLEPAPLTAEATQIAALTAATAGAREQRRSFRRGGNPITVRYARSDNKDNPSEGWVVDRSMGGFCLMTLEEIPVGTQLAVLPTKVVEMIPWVEVEVRNCRLGEDCYEVGCCFVKPPPYSIMLLFG